MWAISPEETKVGGRATIHTQDGENCLKGQGLVSLDGDRHRSWRLGGTVSAGNSGPVIDHSGHENQPSFLLEEKGVGLAKTKETNEEA